MKYFEKYFKDVEFEVGAGEVKVLCPFHSDTRPSASINVEKNLFHCWVCNVGYNEQQFISKVNDISLFEAGKVLDKFKENLSRNDWFLTEKALLWSSEPVLDKLYKLGLSKETIESLDLGLCRDNKNQIWLGIPVFYNGVLMDVRKYNLLKIAGEPKLKAEENAENGLIIPYDIWKTSTTTTYMLEGEKDMLMARELGLNAITLTGGAGATPNDLILNEFKDRDVVICYDNDEAGRNGAVGVYLKLRNVARSVKYINIGDVVQEEKEDFYDFVHKYNKDVLDFLDLEEHDFTNIELPKKVFVPIKKALCDNMLKKPLISEITVNASFEDSYAVPTHINIEKIAETGEKHEEMMVGETRSWFLNMSKLDEILELIEVEAKQSKVVAKYKSLCGVKGTENGIKITPTDFITIYRVKVMDKASKENETESDSYSVELYSRQFMAVGKQYEVNYKLYPHPTKNQKLVALAIDVYDLEGSLDFVPNKDILGVFKNMQDTVENKLKAQFEAMKHHVAKHLDYKLWLMSDLVFNSVLQFDYGDRIRGTLDIFILGDTQVGKSETTSKLTELYDFGHFLSLKTSTTVGLIGGSNKVDGSWLNTVGAIPRQHKRLVVLEEFSGAKPEFIKTMTDIRSSGKLRLARASGEMNVPCITRMITISNPINDENGNPRHLSTFPNGILPLMELIKSAEDVARYDGFLLVSKPAQRFNPFGIQLKGTMLPKEYYEHKIQWVYTRKPEDVVFENGVDSYIWEKAEELNKMFECNFPLFGTTTSLKLARFSVAMASLLVNTDDTFTKVIVSKEIVNEVYRFLISIYDNEVFKLKEYREEYDSYNTITDMEIAEFQRLYGRHTTLFDFIGHQSNTSRNNLRSISGLDGDKFNPVFNALVRLKLIRISGENVFPTQKFRLAMKAVDKDSTISYNTHGLVE